MRTHKQNISLVVIAKNEEKNIQTCLNSVPKEWEKIVVDSDSSDQTAQLALTCGALVYQNKFSNYAEQKNFALSKATNDWVLSLDADEWASEDLIQKIVEVMKNPTFEAYKIRRRLVFNEKIMRFGRTTDFPVRFFNKTCGVFFGEIHEKFSLFSKAKIGYLGCELYHRSYDSLEDYFNKFNVYTSKIAQVKQESQQRVSVVAMCVRPWLEFFKRYVVLCGFLDGYPGYSFALLSSFYMYVKYAKLYEKQTK
jgi:glycosyltransferase involved in cell wall biosynthesis